MAKPTCQVSMGEDKYGNPAPCGQYLESQENGHGEVIAYRCGIGHVTPSVLKELEPRCKKCRCRTGHATGCPKFCEDAYEQATLWAEDETPDCWEESGLWLEVLEVHGFFRLGEIVPEGYFAAEVAREEAERRAGEQMELIKSSGLNAIETI